MQQDVARTELAELIASIPRDTEGFLRWIAQNGERYPYRFELSHGWVSAVQAGSTLSHNRICQNIVAELRARLDIERYDINHADLAVETGVGIRYPDIMVAPFKADGTAYSSADPIMLVEVLSAHSAARDFVEKAGEYSRIPTLGLYLICSQEAHITWYWARRRNGDWPQSPFEIAGLESAVPIDCLGISLTLAKIYKNVPGR